MTANFTGLYAVIDSAIHQDYGLDRLLRQIVEESEIPVVQFRWKSLAGNKKMDLILLAGFLKTKRDFTLIVNDDSEYLTRPEVDGLHLGQKDIALELVRKIHPQKIIGLSVHDAEQAKKAEAKRAAYIGIGSVFPTTSKRSFELIGLESLTGIVRGATLPTVAIGGITLDNIASVAATGCSMAAVIAALVQDGKFQGQALHETFLKARG